MQSVWRLLLAVTLSAVAGTAAQAADAIYAPETPQPILASAGAFDGPYLGTLLGAGVDAGAGFGAVGVVVGANKSVGDKLVLGGEVQGTVDFNGGGLTASELLLLGKLGTTVSENALLYGAAGVGYIAFTAGGGNATYAVGGGVEVGVSDSMSVRGEVLGLGDVGAGLSGVRGATGVLFNF